MCSREGNRKKDEGVTCTLSTSLSPKYSSSGLPLMLAKFEEAELNVRMRFFAHPATPRRERRMLGREGKG
jgi:hypothetical protein